MEIFKTIEEMRGWSLQQRKEGRKIAFVPTMGALHEGHLSLMREGKHRADRLVVSVYVNPTQFGPGEDYSRYPKQAEKDLKLARDIKTDVVFTPGDEIIYPPGYQTYVNVEEITDRLCGASRPGHFKGVTTIVLKLLNIVAPHVAIFGEKDYQQLAVIKRMVADLNLPVDIVGMPTVREKDGLAMSSRNRYLSPGERKSALSIFRSLTKAELMVRNGERDVKKIVGAVRETMETEKVHIDYVKICDPTTLKELNSLRLPALLAVAAFVGPARLIDNCVLK